MNNRMTLITVAFFLLIVGACALPFLYDPSFVDGQKKLQKLAILPVQFKVFLSGMKGRNADPELSQKYERLVQPAIVAGFRGRGYQIMDIDLSPSALSQDQELQMAYKKLQGKYDEYYQTITGKKIVNMKKSQPGRAIINRAKWKRMSPFYISEDCILFCEMAGAQALVFVKGTGNVEGLGKAIAVETARQIAGLGEGKNKNVGFINITVVEGKEGLVMAEVFVPIQMYGKKANEAKIQSYIQRMVNIYLAKFPSASNGIAVLDLFRKPLLIGIEPVALDKP